jgi:hypothetical protein
MSCWDQREAIAELGNEGWRVKHGKLIHTSCNPK